MISDVSARVFPPGWASSISNTLNQVGCASVLLSSPDGREYVESVCYAEYVSLGQPDDVWWENKLRHILQSASARLDCR